MENFQKLGQPGERNSYLRRSTESSSEDNDRMSYHYENPDDANWVVGVDKIHHLISMCGGDLKKFESFYLLRRSNYGSQSSTRDITLGDFTDAVESYMNDANMDPYALVLYLFKMKFGEQESQVYV